MTAHLGGTPAPYRAGYRNERRYFDTLPEAAAYTVSHGGPIAKLCGTLYRAISGAEQDAAVAKVRVLTEPAK